MMPARWPDTGEEVAAMVAAERAAQRRSLQLIASENFVSPAVLAATGSPLTDRFPAQSGFTRLYGGAAPPGDPDALARELACRLFGAEHANVQPHAGSVANLAVLLALEPPGTTVMGMSLHEGGHLSHGQSVNVTGQLYPAVHYGVDPATERLDFDRIEALARQARPRVVFCGASAYPRAIDPRPFREICDAVGARLVYDAAHVAGLIAGGAHPNPTGIADAVTVTTHKTLRGPRGGAILCGAELGAAVDRTVSPGIQGDPLLHVIAAKAVAFAEALTPDYRAYIARVVANARALAAALEARGLRPVTGGTDTHIVMLDLRTLDAALGAREAETVLDGVGISVTRCALPADPRLPGDTSAIRVGPAALTTLGMGEQDMNLVADLLVAALRGRGQGAKLAEVREEVVRLAAAACGIS